MIILASVVALILGSAAVITVFFGERIDTTIRDAVRTYVNEQLRDVAQAEGVDSIAVDIGALEYHVLTQSLKIANVTMQYVDSTEASGKVFRGTIPHVEVSGLAPWSILFGSGLSVGTISIEGIALHAEQWGASEQNDARPQEVTTSDDDGRVLDSTSVSSATLPVIPNVDSLLNALVVGLLPDDVSPLSIGTLVLSNVDLQHRVTEQDSVLRVRVRNAGLTVKDIEFNAEEDREAHVLSNIRLTAQHVSRRSWDGFSGDISGLELQVDDQDTVLQIDTLVYQGDTLVTEQLFGVRISLADRMIRIDSLDVRPNGSDRDFFRALRWRGDRAIIEVSGLELRDLDLDALERGEALRVREIHVDQVHADVVSNLAAPPRPKPLPQLMPHEIFAMVPFTVAVDSLVIELGSLTFGEIHPQNLTPGHLYWDSIHVRVTGISNETSAGGSPPLIASARGRFMHSAPMTARFETDLGTSSYHLRASGSMGRLDLSKLNSFMPYSDNVRMSGIAERATFTFAINGRQATGSVDAVYHDLEAELLEADTKETNIFTSIASWAANWLVLKNDNPPGEDHTVGRIAYTIPRNSAIMQTIWFPLRSGLGDMAGVPIKE